MTVLALGSGRQSFVYDTFRGFNAYDDELGAAPISYPVQMLAVILDQVSGVEQHGYALSKQIGGHGMAGI